MYLCSWLSSHALGSRGSYFSLQAGLTGFTLDAWLTVRTLPKTFLIYYNDIAKDNMDISQYLFL